jgi:hypothetical protein
MIFRLVNKNVSGAVYNIISAPRFIMFSGIILLILVELLRGLHP